MPPSKRGPGGAEIQSTREITFLPLPQNLRGRRRVRRANEAAVGVRIMNNAIATFTEVLDMGMHL